MAAAVVAGGYFFLRRHYKRIEERAEAAYPGPLEKHLG
jgi:hypothetical protein